MKRLVIVLFCFFTLFSFGQDFSTLWKGHFSYYDIKEVVQGNDKIYAASNNAIFSINSQTNELTELTTVNGLSGENISTIYYSEFYELLVIGYENGLIEIVFDNDTEILTIVDIIDKPTISSTDKKINHINPYQNSIYISTNYGISVYDLERLEFRDTYFIGNGGTQIPVTQTTVFNGFIYASCLEGNGLRKAEVTSPDLIDFNNWQVVTTGNLIGVQVHEDKLYAIRTNRIVYEVVNDVFNQLFRYDDVPVEIKSINNNLLVTTISSVFIYDANFNLITQLSVTTPFNTQFNSTYSDGETVFVGTKDFGVLKALINDPTSFEEIRPGGPLRNDLFSIEYYNNNLWGVSGGYDFFYNFIGGDRRLTGISHLKNDDWVNIPYDSISNKIARPWYLSHIAINPIQADQVFISSYYEGLIEVNDNEVTGLFDEDNSTIVPFASDINLTANSTYDSDGTLWVMNGRVGSPLNRYQNGTWTSFGFFEIISDPISHLGFSNIEIDDSSGTKFVGSSSFGLIGFNENGGNPQIENIGSEAQNMPTAFVTAIALDKRNQLWIGTIRGLRVLFNTSNFFTEENITVDEIIIEEDGIAKELLFEQYITDIEVDGSNNKWIGTSDSGLFYLSSDGQKTIFHFTTDNSPLPSNSINDVSLDDINGVVYIATSKGLLSFNSGGSAPFDDLSKAYAYPNPVRPNFNITDEKVKIKELSENINIKITDIEGNLVAEAQSRVNQRYQGFNLEIDGGTAYWNGKNLANNIVASGVYLVMLSDLDTFETKVLKIMVVR
ncbi:MAG: two-component regulator propeller domain-containing protein [Algibacter sp.]|uniref:type IX secretion system anionic LPS delivery protein PorZ n=1 Tax=Algibacter sp. TaxID=1872428 RepID=UPI00260BAD92|nr:two-component regulator propeller domain-containing protein [Algibacter sp.]MDG1730816.1 two-component regulator propeller domain-containing protein [Algibacter sp.]MDG2177522.1 two-component regulator propeller domain-containing protein [Algibacter sp.]